MAVQDLVLALHQHISIEHIEESGESVRVHTRPYALRKEEVEDRVAAALRASGRTPGAYDVLVIKTSVLDHNSPWMIEVKPSLAFKRPPGVPLIVEPLLLS